MGILQTISDAIYSFFYKAEEVKDKDYFIKAFFDYSVWRKNKALNAHPKRDLRKSYYPFSIYGRFWHDDNAKIKSDAAFKMMQALQGQSIHFTYDEMDALRRGRYLGPITKSCEENHLLPETFIQQEKDKTNFYQKVLQHT